jgi:molybdenum-dependent DNA-binding transcriptional regulator ModE
MKKTTEPQTRPPVDREGVRLLAMEIGASAAARKLGINYNTVRSWAKRYNWGDLPERSGRPAIVPATDLQRPGDVLLRTHKELEATTKTALMQTAAKASVNAAKNPPLDVSNTSQFRDLATSSSRIFGWDRKDGPRTQFNQLVISAEKLEELRQLCDTEEKREEASKRSTCPIR